MSLNIQRVQQIVSSWKVAKVENVERFENVENDEKGFVRNGVTIERFALLISCNYKNVPGAQLNGCGNDTQLMEAWLSSKRYANITILTDDAATATRLVKYNPQFPSKANIIANLQSLVNRVNAWTSVDPQQRIAHVVLHYSGHGDQIRDTSGDEVSGKDQVIVPNDFKSAGILVDDDLKKWTVDAFRNQVRFLFLPDSCFSGTVLDLPLVNTTKAPPSPPQPSNNVWAISISGSRDNQTSADAYLQNYKRVQGAMTGSLINVLNRKQTESLTLVQFTQLLQQELKRQRFSQIPQLCCSSTVSPWKDLCYVLF